MAEPIPPNPLYVPVFWKPEFEHGWGHQIDCSGYNMKEENEELEERIRQTFKNFGLVHLIKTGLTDLQDMRRWAKVILQQEMEYKGGANDRNRIEKNVYDTGAPRQAYLHYHHEMAYVDSSTKMLGFCCRASVEGKGYTYVSDGVRTTDALMKTELGKKLAEKNLCYVRKLTDREYFRGKEENHVYNHWQQSFGVEDPEQAQKMAEERGLKVEWGPNRLMLTKFYVSAFEYFPQLDRNLLYSSLADDSLWFDTWPGICAQEPEDRPLKLMFGDDTEFTEEEKHLFVDIFDRFGVPVKWQTGDVAIVCNYRWAHGRPSYDLEEGEERTLGVLLGETFKRVGHLDGKWAPPAVEAN